MEDGANKEKHISGVKPENKSSVIKKIDDFDNNSESEPPKIQEESAIPNDSKPKPNGSTSKVPIVPDSKPAPNHDGKVSKSSDDGKLDPSKIVDKLNSLEPKNNKSKVTNSHEPSKEYHSAEVDPTNRSKILAKQRSKELTVGNFKEIKKTCNTKNKFVDSMASKTSQKSGSSKKPKPVESQDQSGSGYKLNSGSNGGASNLKLNIGASKSGASKTGNQKSIEGGLSRSNTTQGSKSNNQSSKKASHDQEKCPANSNSASTSETKNKSTSKPTTSANKTMSSASKGVKKAKSSSSTSQAGNKPSKSKSNSTGPGSAKLD